VSLWVKVGSVPACTTRPLYAQERMSSGPGGFSDHDSANNYKFTGYQPNGAFQSGHDCAT